MRARSLERFCIEPRLKAFVHQLQDSSLNEAAWVEAISTIVVGKEPRLWTDLDKARYDIRATELVRTFKHLEVLAFEDMRRSEQGARPEHIFRLSVSDRFSNEKEAVISVEPAEAGKFSHAVVVLDELVERLCEGSSVEIALAALSSVSQKYLAEIGESRGVTAVAVKAEDLVSK